MLKKALTAMLVLSFLALVGTADAKQHAKKKKFVEDPISIGI